VKRTIDLDQVRVVQADNYKGNSRVYLEIMDQRILYTDPWALAAHPLLGHHVTSETHGEEPFTRTEHTVDTEGLADMFRAQLGHIFARLLLEARPDLMEGWSTETDREIDYVKPRLAEDRYEG
jgi:hypothetical protein